jgi:hypothetical protein
MANMKKITKQLPEDLDLLREQLYRGAYRDLAEITGYSFGYVVDVMDGRRRNAAIVQAARDLIKAHRNLIHSVRQMQKQES